MVVAVVAATTTATDPTGPAALSASTPSVNRVVPTGGCSVNSRATRSRVRSCGHAEGFERGDVLEEPRTDLDGQIAVRQVRVDPGLRQPPPRSSPEKGSADRVGTEVPPPSCLTCDQHA